MAVGGGEGAAARAAAVRAVPERAEMGTAMGVGVAAAASPAAEQEEVVPPVAGA